MNSTVINNGCPRAGIASLRGSVPNYTLSLNENSSAWRNGYLPETTESAGDGNGFKGGGHGGRTYPTEFDHSGSSNQQWTAVTI